MDCACSTFPVSPLHRQIWHFHVNCWACFYWILQPLLQWKGSYCTRLWRRACVCAEVCCLWMGGHADTLPNTVVDCYEWAVSGDVVFFSDPGPWPSFPAILLCTSKMDKVPKSFTGTICLTWEDGGLWFRCQQAAVHFGGFPKPAWDWGYIALLSFRSPAQSERNSAFALVVLWR